MLQTRRAAASGRSGWERKFEPVSDRASHDDQRRRYLPTRAEAAADALGSVRAEGLDPSRAEPVLAAWARGELTDEQLEEARRLMLQDRDLAADQPLERVVRKDAANDPESGGAAAGQRQEGAIDASN